MNKTLKNLVKRVIDAEFNELQDLNYSDMTEEEKKERDEIYNKVLNLQDKLEEVLTEDQQKLFFEYSDECNLLNAIEQRYMFNRGVKAGLNKLSYIKDEIGNLVIML